MKQLKHLIIIYLLISTSALAKAQGYKITGTVSGLKDNTWLYLRLAKPDKEIDSALVTDGKFSMTGKIAEKATRVYLHTKGYTDYVSFWIENKEIAITVKSGEFKKGAVSGSATEDEDKRMSFTLKPIAASQDSLNKLYKASSDTEVKKGLVAQMRELDQKEQQAYIAFVRGNPQSLVAINLLDIYAATWGKETVLGLYKNMSSAMKITEYGRNVGNFIVLNKLIKIGDKFTDFEQMNAVGKLTKLSAVKGKYVLLDFWASWCGPCREENPALAKTYQDYKEKGFTILGVSLDDNKASWLKAIKDDKLDWENVCDLKGDKNTASVIYGIKGIPDNFLIDPNGIIIAKNLRGEDLDKKLKELMP